MSVNIITPASAFDLSVGTSGCWELRDGKVRLRPHNPANAAHFCDVAQGPFTPPAGPVSTTRKHVRDAALDSSWSAAGMSAIANPVYAGGYEALKCLTGNASAHNVLLPKTEQINLNEFTIHFSIILDTLANARVFISEYIDTVGLKRWQIALTNATAMTATVWSAAGLTTTIGSPALLNGVTLVAGDQIYFKLSYKGVADGTSLACLQAWVVRAAPNQWLLIENVSTATAKLIPSNIKAEQFPALTIPGVWQSNGLIYGNGEPITINMLRRFSGAGTYDAALIGANPGTAFPPIFAATQTGATATIDAGTDGATWDSATATVDDLTRWAANVGDPGLTLQYECGDVLAAHYSAEMTMADFLLEGVLTGRYLRFLLTCVSDGFTNYPVGWIGCEATPSPPAPPTDLGALTRADDIGTIVASGVPAGTTVNVYGINIGASQAFLAPQVLQIGTGVSAGADLTVNLDFSAFPDFDQFGPGWPTPVQIFAICELGGLYSAPCAYSVPSLGSFAGAFSIVSVARAVDLLSAVITVNNVMNLGDWLIFVWSVGGTPHIEARQYAGVDTFTIMGLNALYAFNPSVFAWSQADGFYGMDGYSEAAAITSRPHSYVKKAPHSHEV